MKTNDSDNTFKFRSFKQTQQMQPLKFEEMVPVSTPGTAVPAPYTMPERRMQNEQRQQNENLNKSMNKNTATSKSINNINISLIKIEVGEVYLEKILKALQRIEQLLIKMAAR